MNTSTITKGNFIIDSAISKGNFYTSFDTPETKARELNGLIEVTKTYSSMQVLF